MLEHHLQKQILQKLSIKTTARFAEMRPEGIESNSFTYHLRELVKQKLVIKNSDGTYTITARGTHATAHLVHSPIEILELAHSVLLMAVRSSNNNWLLQKRLTPPMQGKYGFIYAEPNANEHIAITAQKTVEEKTNILTDFTPRCTGYIRVFKDDAQESFIHFNVLESVLETMPDVPPKDITWLADPDFTANDMIPSMYDLVKLLNKSTDYCFTELDYTI